MLLSVTPNLGRPRATRVLKITFQQPIGFQISYVHNSLQLVQLVHGKH